MTPPTRSPGDFNRQGKAPDDPSNQECRVTTRTHDQYQLSGAITAHPRRAKEAAKLAEQVGSLDVVLDPDPDGPPSGFRTTMLAWSSIPTSSTHHLILHDDMTVSASLLERAERAIRGLPDAALAFIAFWNSRNGAAVRQGALAGARWVTATNEYTPLNALILPKDIASGFVEYAEQRAGTWPDDVLLHRYLRAEGVRTLISVPNLAEHDELPSLIANDNQGPRRSACFFDEDPGLHEAADAEETVLEPAAIPFFLYFSHGAALCAVRVNGARRPRWMHVPVEEYLHRFGTSVDALREEADLRVDGIDPHIAWQVWLTGYAMGVCARADGAPDPAELTPSARRVLDRALETVVPGGFPIRPGGWSADRLREVLDPVVSNGLERGLTPPRARPPRTDVKRVAVIGGNSFLGEYLVHGLASRGHTVLSFDTELPDGAHPEVRCATGDRCSSIELMSLLGGVDSVIHAGELCWADHLDYGDNPPRAEEEERALRAALDAAVALRIKRFVLLSSYRVYAADAEAKLIDALERECLQRQSSIDVRIVRLGFPYGPGMPSRNILAEAVRRASLRETIHIGPNTRGPIQPAHLKDITDAVHRTLGGDPDGQVFDIGSATPISIRELCDSVFRVIRPVPVELPNGAWPRDDGPVVAPDRARHQLGWQQTVDLDYGVHNYAQWLAHDDG
jgi:nucleoside-diphosphate-sugar epimerase